MELKIEYLSKYLPYGLKVMMNDGLIYWMHDTSGVVRQGDSLHSVSIADCLRSSCKPILRPLSDLNQEVEILGENFIPIKKLGTRYSSIVCDIYKNTINLDVNDFDSINLLHYRVVFDKLYSMHFDLFRLIDNGLAIDVNTINDTL